ncbi:MAG: hypothetical protein U9Q04_10810 [Campylobacterota bacterium]|nr:hypothetical protein [Campylobacterota bacterium]
MNKVYEEVGKGLIAFANIVTALVFVKDYFDKESSSSLIFGIIFFITVYLLGSKFISKSQEK